MITRILVRKTFVEGSLVETTYEPQFRKGWRSFKEDNLSSTILLLAIPITLPIMLAILLERIYVWHVIEDSDWADEESSYNIWNKTTIPTCAAEHMDSPKFSAAGTFERAKEEIDNFLEKERIKADLLRQKKEDQIQRKILESKTRNVTSVIKYP